MTNFLVNATPSANDSRDFFYYPSYLGPFPDRLDLRAGDFGTDSQGSQGSCVIHGLISQVEYYAKRAGVGRDLSRSFVYREALKLEGRLGQEGLLSPRNAYKVARNLGIPDESICSYDITQKGIDPPIEVYNAAALQVIDRYERMYYFAPWGDAESKIRYIKAALCEGLPVGFVMPVTYEYMKVEGPLEQQQFLGYGKGTMAGYHYQDIWGWTPQGWIVENWWGLNWGDGGFGLIPWNETNNFNEAWVVRGFNGSKIYRSPGIYCTKNDVTQVRAQIVPTPEEDGKPTKIWVAGNKGTDWVLKTPAGGYVPFDGTNLPPSQEITFNDAHDIYVLSGTDLSPYVGIDVYVAYGQSVLDWNFKKICTI